MGRGWPFRRKAVVGSLCRTASAATTSVEMAQRVDAFTDRLSDRDIRPVEASGPLLLDRSQAADLRVKFLDPGTLNPGAVIFVDLSRMRVVTPDAADELLVHWIGSTADAPTVAIITPDKYIQQSIHAALAQAGRAMYVSPSMDDMRGAKVLGFLDEGQKRLVATVQRQGEIGVSEAAKELKSTEDVAGKELAYLEHQGLVHRRGDGYIYPFAPRR